MPYILIDSPIGPLRLEETAGALSALRLHGTLIAGQAPQQTLFLQEVSRQLQAYFAGELHTFELPLCPQGTAFQQRVWQALCTIPYGQTRSYGDIAAQIGHPKASRAVGGANHVNPIAIIVPCHRVIGADGTLTGYGGGLEIKKFLLDLEQKYS